MQSILFPIIRFLHDLSTAVWVGGMIVMLLVVLPALKKDHSIKDPRKTILAIQDRMKVLAIASMVILAISGLMLSKRAPEFSGLLRFSTPFAMMLSIKHLLMIVMVILSLTRLWVSQKRDKKPNSRRDKIAFLLLAVNSVVGIVVLFLSAYISAVL